MKKKNLRFEKFSKLSDIEKMGIGFIVCLFLMLGCITIYKTFAIYKEETTFDVIEGIVPDFKKKDKDLEIAIMVDGESTTEVPEGKDYRVKVECDTEEISGTWNYTNWNAHIEGNITMPATCTIIFESIYDSIIVDGEERTEIPDKGDYQYNLTCNNVTNSSFDEETWKPIVTGVKENSSCSIVFKSTNNIITKIIDANGNEVESYPSKEEAYDAKITCTPNSVTVEWDRDNWKPIITNITNETTCEIEFSNFNLADEVTVGDYIAYTPSKTSYDIVNSLTGIDTYSGSDSTVKSIKSAGKQTINPSELNLWRVIKVNEDDTIELVSEYASSKTIYFAGKDGYRKFVGSLNTITKEAYETEGIAEGSHHMGYDGELDECSAYDTCNDEKTGSTGYQTESEDTQLVTAAIGNKKATTPDGTTKMYWLASRYRHSTGSLYGRKIELSGEWENPSNHVGITSWDGNNRNYESSSLRPIVTLKSGLMATEGSKNGKKLWTIEQ